MRPRLSSLTLLLPLFLGTSACLENKERIQVNADGSILVTASAEGNPNDLAGGYNLALGPPWVPLDEGARAWIRHLGGDTGSAEVVARAAEATEADWTAWFGDAVKDDGIRATVQADFASVADWPRFLAPESDPYRAAYLERSASLRSEDKGDRIVYTFERTYHARPYDGFDLKDRLEDAFDDDVIDKKLDEFLPLTADELRSVATTVRDEYRALFESLGRTALDVAYTRGSATLAPESAQRTLAALESVADHALRDEAVSTLWDRIRAWVAELEADKDNAGPNPMELYDAELRDRLREALVGTLASEEVEEATANEVRFALEWAFTQYDHSLDLSDEKFVVAIDMPGTIVAGNFDDADDGEAHWSFEAERLRDRDVVLRAVSVLVK